MKRTIIIGSRGSDLALWQTGFVKAELEKRTPGVRFEVRVITTKGDQVLDKAISKIADTGLFSTEIEDALLAEEIDLAVHSLKDMRTVQPAGLKIAAIVTRELPDEVLISKKYSSLDDLPAGARVATGSLRRRSQLLKYRPDLKPIEIRGNVPTRIDKCYESDLDALVVAFAGVHRLQLDKYIKQIIPTEIILPAPGQGAIAVEIREDDREIEKAVSAINNSVIEACVTAERSFLNRLGGGCEVPIGALAAFEGAGITLRGFVGNLTGTKVLGGSLRGNRTEAEVLGKALAEVFRDKGVEEILIEAREQLWQLEDEVV